MLRYFPEINNTTPHHVRDYVITGVTFLCVTLALSYDGRPSTTFFEQNLLALLAWIILIIMLEGECRYTRMQVMIAVAFATIGENFASLYMEGYIYKLKNLPLYVPAGHGMVYLSAVALGRSGLFQRHARKISVFVVIVGALWALWGVSPFTTRDDKVGLLLFCAFLICLFKGRSPMVYLGAFFVTSWLEIVGTSAGTWAWAEIDPASGLTQGNPPSGVAAWYCLVDAVAISGATPALNLFDKWLYKLKKQQIYDS